jgi:hypothetical protein
MNPTVDQPTNTIHLTHPRICAFYEKNAHISPETINLFMIDLLESTVSNTETISTEITTIPPHQYQINELNQTLDQIKHAITHQTTSLTTMFSQAKTKYVNEFCSIWAQSDCVSKREYLLQNNSTIIHTLEQMTLEIRNIKGVHHTIGEKITAIIKQFHKIINTNIESILSKTTDMSTLSKEFIQNFEMNSAHMIQTVQQILCDFVSTKDTQTKTALDTFNANRDGANALYSKLLYEFNDFLYHIRVQPAVNTPNQLETILSRLYNTASIESEIVDATTSNIFLSRGVGKPELFIQQRTIHDRNVNVDEIKSFIQTAHEQSQHGILISQHTGITTKPNLSIEILQNRVFLYVHTLEYSPEKMQTAIEIVDTISAKLAEFNVSSEEKYAIPKEILDEVNREYQTFIGQKETIMNTLKEMYKKVLAQVEDIRFVSLDKYLSTRYSSCKKQGYVCSLCNSFTVSTLKGLAAHKRGCNRKLRSISETKSKEYEETPENAVRRSLSGVVQKSTEPVVVKYGEANTLQLCSVVSSSK